MCKTDAKAKINLPKARHLKNRKSLLISYPNRASILISLCTCCKGALAWGPVQANVNLMNYHLTYPNKLVHDNKNN